MFVLTVEFKIKHGHEKDVENAFKTVIPHVGKEEGAIEYTMHRDTEDASVIFFYERYINRAAWEAHDRTRHVDVLRESLEGKLDGEPKFRFYEYVSGIGK